MEMEQTIYVMWDAVRTLYKILEPAIENKCLSLDDYHEAKMKIGFLKEMDALFNILPEELKFKYSLIYDNMKNNIDNLQCGFDEASVYAEKYDEELY